MPKRLLALLALVACVTAACGKEEKAATTRLVKPGKPPLVNAFSIDPTDGTFLMSTNRGFFRITKDGKKLTRLKSSLTAKEGKSPVGTFLAFVPVGTGGKLLGSGHPDDKKSGLPAFLGAIESDDDGKTWRSLSRMGIGDLHVIRPIHNRIYAFDAVLGGMLISTDDGKNWTEKLTPRGLIVDFVVDPTDPDYLLATTDSTTYRSTDQGDTWRPLEPVPSPRFAWPKKDVLYRAQKDGTFEVSSDRGESFEPVGRMDGEPWRLHTVDEKHLFAAMSDGSILKTDDGGKSWGTVFTP
jgi:hypothetical protein